jgi:chemotaxis protein histidine kinase CheA
VQEAKALLGRAAADGNVVRAPLSVRQPKQAKQLDAYDEHSTLNDAQWAGCMNDFASFARKGRVQEKRPWFITEQEARPYLAPRKTRKKSESAPAGGVLVRAHSVGSAVASVGSAEAHALAPIDENGEEDEADGVYTSRGTTNRWRLREYLAHDYAEYRSCCGQPSKWTQQFLHAGLAGSSLVAEHCSHTPRALFNARLKHRDSFSDKRSYDLNVASELSHAMPKWMGYPVCCSCFRAALGLGRDALFRLPKVLTAADSEAVDLTQSGTLRQSRSAPLRDRALNLLRSFCDVQGQIAPNPNTSDPTNRRFIVPQKHKSEFLAALGQFDQGVTKPDAPKPLHASTIHRAIKQLEAENFFISLGKGSSLCRCAVCDMLDNQCAPAYVKEHKLDPKKVLTFKAQKLSHLKQMQEQRAYFDSHKNAAMLQPTNEWCITFDGMDQSKTQLPSRARFSKDLEPLPRIKLHCTGAFCFGGSNPVIGLMNTPEIRKDAALSVVTLERILDLQWLELEKQHHAGERVVASRSEAASQAAASQAAASHAAAEEGKMEDLEQADASTQDSSAAAYSGPALRWPKLLHVTFDNASGEAKNQFMFRFLGLLVFHGLFQAITASMLLVGHTHDIVDQMFSVWARMLRIHNAETYEKMRALFREKYHSRIDGLVQLMKGKKEAYDALSEEERLAYDDEVKEAAVEWSEEQAKILEDFSVFVKKHNMLRPDIVQQTVTIDVEGWLCKAVAADSPPTLKGIPRAYNFAVEKDDKGNVYLYNNQFANSADVMLPKAMINYPHQMTGSYTTRALLYLGSDPGLATDPYRTPPLMIDLAPLRATANKYVEHKAMSGPERDQFVAMLDRLQAGQDKQQADCLTCYEALVAFGQHGVVSQRKRAPESERKQASKKISARAMSWTQLQAHLRDPAFADVHDAKMVHTGFWTKWLTRYREHIQPAFIERGIIFNPTDLAEPYHAADTELCSGVGEPPVHSDRAERIDLKYLHQHGTPAVGQVAVVRTAESREPFYLGKILAVTLTGKAKRKMEAKVNEEAAAQAEPAESTAAQPAAAAAAAAASAPGLGESEMLHSARLKDLVFEVSYYDLRLDDYKLLHLTAEGDSDDKQASDNEWWTDEFAKGFSEQPQTEAELQRAMKKATAERRPPPPRPCWLVDLYSDARFLFDSCRKKAVRYEASGAMMVAWGAAGTLLKSSGVDRGHQTWQLRAPVWRQVREDLTESKLNESAGTTAKGAARTSGNVNKKKRVTEEDSSDSDQEVSHKPSGRGAAAAAAASTRPRLARSAHAHAIVEHSNDEDEEEDQEEAEEEEEAESAGEEDGLQPMDTAEDDAPLNFFTNKQQHPKRQLSEPKQAVASQLATPPQKKQKKTTAAPAAASAAAAAAAAAAPAPATSRRSSLRHQRG